MDVNAQIDRYISNQPSSKSGDIQELHRLITRSAPGCKMWFLDGRDESGKVVSNPNIGYGQTFIKYASGEIREFYRVGVSANTSGISIYVMGLDDKKYLPATYGGRLGRAKVTGYCVNFSALKTLNIDVLEEMIAEFMGEA